MFKQISTNDIGGILLLPDFSIVYFDLCNFILDDFLLKLILVYFKWGYFNGFVELPDLFYSFLDLLFGNVGDFLIEFIQMFLIPVVHELII